MRRFIIVAFTANVFCGVFSYKDIKCTRPHEYYDPCPYNCPPQTCDSLDRAYACPIGPVRIDGKVPCHGACRCKRGYYRNAIGECISEANCRKCSGPHEYFSCGVFCDNVCETLKEQNQTNCPIETFVCVKQCYCEKDYARAANGTCIPIPDCEISCNGDPNAQPGCGTYCNRRCSDIGKEPQACITLCKENACDCKDGFFLNEVTGKCVRAEDCPLSCGNNEVFTHCIQGQSGPQTCRDVGKPLPCPRIDPKYCKKGCLCKPGYVRDDNGVCIPKNKCPCGRNEVYNSCIQGYCAPKTCSELGQPIPCPDINPEFCEKGCLCEPGYVRNDRGYCIPVKECPSCGGDPNAMSGCGVNCNKRCSTYGKEPQFCPLFCKINGCDCKDGFLFDEATGRCVRPCDCSNEN
ncbi:hypothetical protein K1T71_004592 [Dendrolimus kikuchii]|uniref:Uncharacterized protein n=1 Tax=Dendrolimus kikuchii TaxID=765133 RepID=A0ACC1D8J3_9NEOP|nr:hypothetical protein K1T71_004592 [Dendrolimus kikuchii]